MTPPFASAGYVQVRLAVIAAGARFVAPGGNNAWAGTYAAPWATITYAATQVVAGDTVYVRGGSYHEAINISADGTAVNPIRFLAFPGELPIVDGENDLPVSYTGLLKATGDYVYLSGFDVRNSAYFGAQLDGTNCILSHLRVHDNDKTGVYANGDYSIVQDSLVWNNSLCNEWGVMAETGGWGTGISMARVAHGTPCNYGIVRRCIVWENWGEGINTFEATHTLIENNIAHDNFSTNFYISDATDVLLQRNFAYNDPDSHMHWDPPDVNGYHFGGANIGIMLGNEGYSPSLNNNTIVNNIVYGCSKNLYQGSNAPNTTVANNTFINAIGTKGIQINSNETGSVYENNIVQQDNSLGCIAHDQDGSGITFINNQWSKAVPAYAQSGGDVVGDPLLADVAAHPFVAESYKLTGSSPGLAGATVVAAATPDYFGVARSGTTPDMGAGEYVP